MISFSSALASTLWKDKFHGCEKTKIRHNSIKARRRITKSFVDFQYFWYIWSWNRFFQQPCFWNLTRFPTWEEPLFLLFSPWVIRLQFSKFQKSKYHKSLSNACKQLWRPCLASGHLACQIYEMTKIEEPFWLPPANRPTHLYNSCLRRS